jgi:hypothetical protein
MLDFGNRGLLLTMDLANDCLQMKNHKNQPLYDNIQTSSGDLVPKIYNRAFELEILKILK